jgi:ABC-type multidrug transport system fused ATPase/permease subunit
LRSEIADLHAQASFFPYVSKYVIESSVVIGGILLAGVQLLLQDTAAAVTILSMFLASGTRIAPAVLRIQQGAITIKSSKGFAELALSAIHEMNAQKGMVAPELPTIARHVNFKPELTIASVSFTYPNRTQPAIKNLTLTVSPGETIAIVGGSGSGKTTLLDLMLGILPSDAGEIQISGMPPVDAIKLWPGKIAYVPQDIQIIDGTISENVSMGYSCDGTSRDAIRYAIEMASLTDFVSSLENGFDTYIGEKGVQISGGQRQRLGIARALYTKPKLIVLDEATSALDNESEKLVQDALSHLMENHTVLVIAHRLSTIQHADLILVVQDGEIIERGTHTELMKIKKGAYAVLAQGITA